MVAFVGAFHPIFLHITSVSDLLQQASSYGIVALGMVFMLSMGDVDLSVGGNMGLSAVCCAPLIRGGMSPLLGGLLGLGVGTLLGLANAVVANRLASTGVLCSGDTERTSSTAAVRAGLSYVPADRRTGGVMLDQSVTENVCQITAGVKREFGPMLSRHAMREAASTFCKVLSINTASLDTPVGALSATPAVNQCRRARLWCRHRGPVKERSHVQDPPR